MNVYLNKKLTVIDVYLQQLFQWVFSSGFVISAAADRYVLRNIVKNDRLRMFLGTSPVVETHKTGYETLNSTIRILTSGALSAFKYPGGESKIFLETSPVDMLYRPVVQGSPAAINLLTSAIDDYLLKVVPGEHSWDIFINAEPLESIKVSYERLAREILLDAQGEESIIKSLEQCDVSLKLRVKARGYRMLLDVDELPLENIDVLLLRDLDYVDGFDITCIKNIAAGVIILPAAYLTGDISLYKLRKLADMDNADLSAFDSMTLTDLKHIES